MRDAETLIDFKLTEVELKFLLALESVSKGEEPEGTREQYKEWCSAVRTKDDGFSLRSSTHTLCGFLERKFQDMLVDEKTPHAMVPKDSFKPPDVADWLAQLCTEQHAFMNTYLNPGSAHKHIRIERADAWNQPRVRSFFNTKRDYKLSTFTRINGFLVYRGNHIDYQPKFGFGNVDDQDTIQYMADITYVFLRGILTLPQSEERRMFITYRSLARMKGSSLRNSSLEDFLRPYTRGAIIPNYTFVSTGLRLSKAAVEGQVVLMIRCNTPDLPIMGYHPNCTQGNMEETEVLLPYTTDPTGRTLTWGYKVDRVERDKDIFIEEDGTSVKAAALIKVRVVMLERPLPILGLKDFPTLQERRNAILKDFKDTKEGKTWLEKFDKLVEPDEEASVVHGS